MTRICLSRICPSTVLINTVNYNYIDRCFSGAFNLSKLTTLIDNKNTNDYEE